MFERDPSLEEFPILSLKYWILIPSRNSALRALNIRCQFPDGTLVGVHLNLSEVTFTGGRTTSLFHSVGIIDHSKSVYYLEIVFRLKRDRKVMNY